MMVIRIVKVHWYLTGCIYNYNCILFPKNKTKPCWLYGLCLQPRYSCHKVCGWIDAFVQNNSYCKWYMRKRKMPTYNEITSRSSVVCIYTFTQINLAQINWELCGQWLCPPCWEILPYPCLFFTITKAFPTGK